MNRDAFSTDKMLIAAPSVEPHIAFHPANQGKEVMRIDRHGVKVNPEYTVDEAAQHVLNALTAHIQHTVNHAVAAERDRCCKIIYGMAGSDNVAQRTVDAIRSQQ